MQTIAGSCASMRLQSPECSVRHRSDEEGCLTNHKGPRWGVDGNKCDRAGPALVQSRGLSSQARVPAIKKGKKFIFPPSTIAEI